LTVLDLLMWSKTHLHNTSWEHMYHAFICGSCQVHLVLIALGGVRHG
jgi:succinate dehydrogenase/fumarate reductase-like Fe-S protein